ncbi:MAG: hypothetical protein Q3966_00015, partial [Neisseria sp.]|nr:hypothetical protein [Neisseria sp.]
AGGAADVVVADSSAKVLDAVAHVLGAEAAPVAKAAPQSENPKRTGGLILVQTRPETLAEPAVQPELPHGPRRADRPRVEESAAGAVDLVQVETHKG